MEDKVKSKSLKKKKMQILLDKVSNLKPDLRNPKTKQTETLDEEAEAIFCYMWDFNTKVAKDLRKHIRNKHSIHIFHGVEAAYR